MKQGICILTIALMAISVNGFSQALQATKDKALIRILVLNQDEKPIRERLELVAKSTGETYPAMSDEKGIAALLVPAGATVSARLFIMIFRQPGYPPNRNDKQFF